jgi:hypothetical protein
MHKLVSFFKIDSRQLGKPTLIVLILANLVPLYGVLFLHWKVFPILFVFWIENIIIGIYNLIKMVYCQGFKKELWGIKANTIMFFSLHYGIFTLVHGMFIVVLFSGIMDKNGSIDGWSTFVNYLSNFNLILAVIALTISHGVSLWLNYFGSGEYKDTTLTQLMTQPYGRVVITHLTIMASGLLLKVLNAPLVGLIVLVILKMGLDILSHISQHRNTDKFAGKIGIFP